MGKGGRRAGIFEMGTVEIWEMGSPEKKQRGGYMRITGWGKFEIHARSARKSGLSKIGPEKSNFGAGIKQDRPHTPPGDRLLSTNQDA